MQVIFAKIYLVKYEKRQITVKHAFNKIDNNKVCKHIHVLVSRKWHISINIVQCFSCGL